MKESQKSPVILQTIILAVALIISATIGGFSYSSAHPTESNSISVTGTAERPVDADIVKWSLALSQSVPPTNQADAGHTLDKSRDAFLTLLATAGINKESVSIQPMSLSTIESTVDYKTGRTDITGYSATQVLVIESSKVTEVGMFAQSAATLMAEKGANLSTQAMEYYYNKLADLKLELLTAATKNARLRGEAIVASEGKSLGSVTSADTGVFQVTAANSADFADYGTYDTTSPHKLVKAVVHTTFKLK